MDPRAVVLRLLASVVEKSPDASIVGTTSRFHNGMPAGTVFSPSRTDDRRAHVRDDWSMFYRIQCEGFKNRQGPTAPASPLLFLLVGSNQSRSARASRRAMAQTHRPCL